MRRQWRGVCKAVSEDVRASFHSCNIARFGGARIEFVRSRVGAKILGCLGEDILSLR